MAADPDNNVPLAALAGYLNFSEGKPDPRFQKQFNDAYSWIARHGAARPWEALPQRLLTTLGQLQASKSPAFRDTTQAEAIVHLVFDRLVPAYRAHHADLLFHLAEADWYQPFFLTRACEAVLVQGGPWDDADRIVRGALVHLNDFMGHRPLAVLEQHRGQPYDHEKVRPIPLYLRGAGVAYGRYEELIARTMAIFQESNPALLEECCFDPGQLEELALDPRGYDFGHPVDKRPNYQFGEWDPHQIDARGNYTRFVLRQVTLEGFWQRAVDDRVGPREETMFEAAAVLAGTMLMAATVSGAGPGAHDSTVNLSKLVPRIAQNRERFYQELIDRMGGDQGRRLREEAKATRQPFGGARQHINHYLAGQRAWLLQQRRLALLFADLGYGAAARRQIDGLAVASARMVTEMHLLLTMGQYLATQGRLEEAMGNLQEAENLLHRAIAAGALVDPWNILGFQGQFSRWQALEDSVADPRVDELVELVDEVMHLYARILSEGAARGRVQANPQLINNLNKLAAWWDQFATATVHDVPHLFGEETAASAIHVAQAIGRWQQHGQGTDLAFWRDQLEGFRSPKAFALVLETLLDKQEFRAAMGLLMTWISQAEQIPLEEGEHSFHGLALGWMLGVWAQAEKTGDQARALDLARKFFDYLEVNAESYWQAPKLDLGGQGEDWEGPMPGEVPDEEAGQESLFDAAYDEMTYRDSGDDGNEGAVLDFQPNHGFDLAEEAERLQGRLQFLGTLARLWNIASRMARQADTPERVTPLIQGWLGQGRRNFQGLLELLDAIHAHEIAKPSGDYDAIVEFDRRRVTKERLLGLVISACLDQALAIGALRGVVGDDQAQDQGPPWEPLVIRLERALLQGDPEAARQLLPAFRQQFRGEPLLYPPLQHGGSPRFILRASLAQTILRGLAANLPRQGLIRETYQLVRLARAMEQAQTLTGPRITEFDRLFQLAIQAVTDAALDAAEETANLSLSRLTGDLENLVEPFLAAWMDHSQSLRVATLESLTAERDWTRLKDFIHRYGNELFQARFLNLGNLRGILHRGVGPYLDDLAANPDLAQPLLLLNELGGKIPRAEAEQILQLILQALIENYDLYQDYRANIAQADFGENLRHLFDFFRLKASYERNAWRLRPLGMVHETLARRSCPAADRWRRQVEGLARQAAEDHLRELARLEQQHGMRLATLRSRLEERFVEPLEFDRLAALIEPALEAAPAWLGKSETTPLEEEIRPLAAKTTGVGLDVPVWLSRLEGELHRIRSAKTALASLAESLFQVPRVIAPWPDLVNQLKDWKQLALEDD